VDANTFSAVVSVYDGARRVMQPAPDILFRVINPLGRQTSVGFHQAASVRFDGLPYDGTGGAYSFVVWADGYRQCGISVVPMIGAVMPIELMLLRSAAQPDLSSATFAAVSARFPFLTKDPTAQPQYKQALASRPMAIAAMLNILTAMDQITLKQGSPAQYLQGVRWDSSLAQDRFFAYCDPQLQADVEAAANQGLFEEEKDPAQFHQGATASWKQVQFDMANVQLTFHDPDASSPTMPDGAKCPIVEPDIDYYKDLAAHGLFEVIPNKLSQGLTNPEVVYAMRWTVGQEDGAQEFSPPYVIT